MKMSRPTTIKTIQVNCGELCTTGNCSSDSINLVNTDINGLQSNITVDLASFVKNPHSLSNRILDLLQLGLHFLCGSFSESW